jgi:thiol-disulfide isomerase/thioredoxin
MARFTAFLLASLAACMLLSTAAWAGRFGPGDRPSDISGRNVQDNKILRLEDFRGKWVLIDFFATWCGPCMGELPNLVAVTKPLIGADFAVVGVSLDYDKTMDKLRPVMKEKGVTYPVIFPGGGWDTPAAKEWGVGGIPDTYLISPQGVVVATNLRGADLKPALAKFLGLKEPYAPTCVRVSYKRDKENKKFTLSANFNNPKAAETKIKLSLSLQAPKKNEKGEVVDYTNVDHSEELTVPTPDGWEVAKDFTYDLPDGCTMASYSFSVYNPQVDLWIGIDDYAWFKD